MYSFQLNKGSIDCLLNLKSYLKDIHKYLQIAQKYQGIDRYLQNYSRQKVMSRWRRYQQHYKEYSR